MKILRTGLILFLFAAAAGAVLSFVHEQTAGLITEVKAERIYGLEKEILPTAQSFKQIEDGNVVMGFDTNGRMTGTIVRSYQRGYGGKIEMLVGLDENSRVTKVKIVKHFETPGLGSKVTREGFLDQFSGKNLASIFIKKDNPNGEIEAVTGATVSSRAVVEGVKKALARLSNYEEKIEEPKE